MKLARYGAGTIFKQLVRPIALFFPQKLDGPRRGRDWNLTLTGVALFIYVLSDVSIWQLSLVARGRRSSSIQQVYNLKYLYVRHVFDWDSEQVSVLFLCVKQ
jgi:hypothetical protein